MSYTRETGNNEEEEAPTQRNINFQLFAGHYSYISNNKKTKKKKLSTQVTPTVI